MDPRNKSEDDVCGAVAAAKSTGDGCGSGCGLLGVGMLWSLLASTVATHSTVILGLGPRIQSSAGDEHGDRGDTWQRRVHLRVNADPLPAQCCSTRKNQPVGHADVERAAWLTGEDVVQ